MRAAAIDLEGAQPPQGRWRGGLRIRGFGDFDLVISDIVMPRKDGLQTIRELREMPPDIPIVAMSGGTHFSSGSGGQDVTSYALSVAEVLGATRTISKPFSRDNLLMVIRESMSETGSQFFDEHAR